MISDIDMGSVTKENKWYLLIAIIQGRKVMVHSATSSMMIHHISRDINTFLKLYRHHILVIPS